MRRNNKRMFSGSLGLLILMASFCVLLPAEATSATADQICSPIICSSPEPSPSVDSDGDGFSDYQECCGINMADLTVFPGYKNKGVLLRNQYLDPSTRDLFVIIVPSANSLIPANPTATIANVGITAHEIPPSKAFPDRTVTSATTQKAVMITENSDGTLKDSSGNYLPFGNSNYGTPNNLDGATVWTQRIKNYIYTVACPSPMADSSCKDSVSGAVGRDAVIAAYIRNTIPHEGGHVMKLTTTSNSRYGGYHYVTGSNTVMEQSIVYKKSGGVVTFTIPSSYASGDATAAKLK